MFKPAFFLIKLQQVLVIGLAVSLPSMVLAVPASEPQALNNLSQLLGKMTGLQANFVQTVQTSPSASIKTIQAIPKKINSLGLQAPRGNQRFSGTMQVKRPNLFRWETQMPSKQLIISDSRTVWIYDPDLQQATRQTLSQQVSDTPALLLSGQPSSILKTFKVTQPDSNQTSFVLFPRQKASSFDQLTLNFEHNMPTSMLLRDTLGQQTMIQFSQVSLNPKLDNSLFTFTPPKGIDIIEQNKP